MTTSCILQTETGQSRVFRVELSTGVVTTLVGVGAGALSYGVGASMLFLRSGGALRLSTHPPAPAQFSRHSAAIHPSSAFALLVRGLVFTVVFKFSPCIFDHQTNYNGNGLIHLNLLNGTSSLFRTSVAMSNPTGVCYLLRCVPRASITDLFPLLRSQWIRSGCSVLL